MADDDAQKTFDLVQGDPGISVGFIRERHRSNDVALAQLHDDVVFENRFTKMDATPKRFLASHEQKKDDLYVMDTFLTGKQYLVGSGRRFSIARGYRLRFCPPNSNGDSLPQANSAYISLKQGAFTTSSPGIFRKLHDRVAALSS